MPGIRTQQAEDIAGGRLHQPLSGEEKGTIRKEQDLKASLKFRDDPFRS